MARVLAYYDRVQCPFVISIGDSSRDDVREQTKALIKTYQGKLTIEYTQCPHLNDSQTIKLLIDQVKTPYAVFIADDDFLVPNGLLACVNFLEQHPDYVAAHGRGMIFSLQDSGVVGKLKELGPYRLPILEQDTAAVRLLTHLTHYTVTLFAVHRTATWKMMYASIENIKDKRFTELVPCCLSVVQGKIKQIECLYLLRQGHAARYLLPDSFDWLTSPQWQESYQQLLLVLSQGLMHQDNITQAQGLDVVKQGFWCYLNRGLQARYQQKYAKPSTTTLMKEQLKKVPGVSQALGGINRLLTVDRSYQLAYLLNKQSVDYQDFKPLYDSIVTLAGEKS